MNTENNPSGTTADTEQAASATPQPSLRWLWSGLAAAVIVVGIVVYTGIHERAMAESTLGTRTEQAAIPTVTVVQPSPGALSQEIVLPGNTEPFNATPIYARTNGYLKSWYVSNWRRLPRHAGRICSKRIPSPSRRPIKL